PPLHHELEDIYLPARDAHAAQRLWDRRLPSTAPGHRCTDLAEHDSAPACGPLVAAPREERLGSPEPPYWGAPPVPVSGPRHDRHVGEHLPTADLNPFEARPCCFELG